YSPIFQRRSINSLLTAATARPRAASIRRRTSSKSAGAGAVRAIVREGAFLDLATGCLLATLGFRRILDGGGIRGALLSITRPRGASGSNPGEQTSPPGASLEGADRGPQGSMVMPPGWKAAGTDNAVS